MSLEKARESVARGAALLDSAKPRWWEQIDLGRLQVMNPDCCVLGQVYEPVEREDGFAEGLDALGLDDVSAVRYGFDAQWGAPGEDGLPKAVITYGDLLRAWRELIGSRREPA